MKRAVGVEGGLGLVGQVSEACIRTFLVPTNYQEPGSPGYQCLVTLSVSELVIGLAQQSRGLDDALVVCTHSLHRVTDYTQLRATHYKHRLWSYLVRWTNVMWPRGALPRNRLKGLIPAIGRLQRSCD